jgi:hypothetical protein
MTRTEAIAIITSKLASADEATVMTVTDILAEAEQPSATSPRVNGHW